MKDERRDAAYWRNAYETLVDETGRDLNDGLGVDPRRASQPATSGRAQALRSQPSVEGWRPIETAPTGERILLWVTGNLQPGARFGSAYRGEGGKIIAKPEGGNGDWTKDITHWQPLPVAPDARQINSMYEGKG